MPIEVVAAVADLGLSTLIVVSLILIAPGLMRRYADQMSLVTNLLSQTVGHNSTTIERNTSVLETYSKSSEKMLEGLRTMHRADLEHRSQMKDAVMSTGDAVLAQTEAIRKLEAKLEDTELNIASEIRGKAEHVIEKLTGSLENIRRELESSSTSHHLMQTRLDGAMNELKRVGDLLEMLKDRDREEKKRDDEEQDELDGGTVPVVVDASGQRKPGAAADERAAVVPKRDDPATGDR